MKRTIVTIGRQTGSGGREIGIKVAEEFGIPFYDQALISKAAETADLSSEFIKAHDEKKASSLLYSIVMDTFAINPSLPSADKVFLAQFNAIKEIAKEGSCVIVGRCGDYALENDPDLISIFLYADFDFRTERIKKELGCSLAEAKSTVIKTDKQRSGYYNHYTGKKWGDIKGFDLGINTSKFGIDTCVRMICDIIREKAEEQ